MNDLIKGVGIEVRELSVVGVFMVALFPGYLWVRKATTVNQVLGRSATVGGLMLAAAVAEGIRRRK